MERRKLIVLGMVNVAMFAGCKPIRGLLRPKRARANPHDNHFEIMVEDKTRVIKSSSIPNHITGLFPNPNNPFPIRAQHIAKKMPLDPIQNANSIPIGVYQFGIATNGVMFDPAGPFLHGDQRSGWEFEPLSPNIGPYLGVDENNAHTQPNGTYHYHGFPSKLWENLGGEKSKNMILMGYAADGFPIYGPFAYKAANDANSDLVEMHASYRLKKGKRQYLFGEHNGDFINDYEFDKTLGDLDECNGRFGITPQYPNGTYYYCLTRNYPFIPRRFRGTPDESFKPKGGGPKLGEVPPGLRDYPNLKPPFKEFPT